MAKWARRAKSLPAGREAFLQKWLAEVVSEAADIQNSLLFVLETAGQGMHGVLQLDESGLQAVEDFYRKVFRVGGTGVTGGIDELERLLALFVGQVIVSRAQGDWAIYTGRYYALQPIGVRLRSSQRYLDVSLLCKNLATKTGMIGASEKAVLVRIVQDPERFAIR